MENVGWLRETGWRWGWWDGFSMRVSVGWGDGFLVAATRRFRRREGEARNEEMSERIDPRLSLGSCSLSIFLYLWGMPHAELFWFLLFVFYSLFLNERLTNLSKKNIDIYTKEECSVPIIFIYERRRFHCNHATLDFCSISSDGVIQGTYASI